MPSIAVLTLTGVQVHHARCINTIPIELTEQKTDVCSRRIKYFTTPLPGFIKNNNKIGIVKVGYTRNLLKPKTLWRMKTFSDYPFKFVENAFFIRIWLLAPPMLSCIALKIQGKIRKVLIPSRGTMIYYLITFVDPRIRQNDCSE